MSNAKFAAALPDGDANGLSPIIRDLIRQPDKRHVIIAIVDCKQVTTDHDLDKVSATARIRRVEVVRREDLETAERLMRRALESRSGHTVLPFDLEDDIRLAFHELDPPQGGQ